MEINLKPHLVTKFHPINGIRDNFGDIATVVRLSSRGVESDIVFKLQGVPKSVTILTALHYHNYCRKRLFFGRAASDI